MNQNIEITTLTQTFYNWFQECIRNGKDKFDIIYSKKPFLLSIKLTEKSHTTFSIIIISPPDISVHYTFLLEQPTDLVRPRKSNYFLIGILKYNPVENAKEQKNYFDRVMYKTYFAI